MNRWKGIFGVVALFVVLTFPFRPVQAISAETYEKLRLFSQIYQLIETSYVKEVDTNKILDGAIEGMLKQLDPHSSFMSPDETRHMMEETKGEFGGLGIQISPGKGGIRIMTSMVDTPAFRNGIKSGDLIIKIGEESTKEMGIRKAVSLMRGPAGEPIVITVQREGEKEPLVFDITREIIQIDDVKWRMEDAGIGYVRIAKFGEKTATKLQEAIADLKNEKDLNGLVLDLRDNPGGLLDQAVEVSDAFIDDGVIVYTKSRTPQHEMRFEAKNGDWVRDVPMVVLINGGSASASEIVAATLKGHKRALLMGTKTFGKGSVQQIRTLGEGYGVRLTVSQYYTVLGSVQAKGVTPDVLVEDIERGPARQTNATYEKDLEGHLKNGSDSEQEEEYDGTTGRLKDDYQLERAVALLKGVQIMHRK